jgi:hypothetical protein
MSSDNHIANTNAVPPEEVLEHLLIELRAYAGVIEAWAEMLSGEIYQELRPQAIEALQSCAKHMQVSYDEIKAYLEERRAIRKRRNL